MRFAVMIEGQMGVTWEDWVALAEACERLGFEALFRSDHYGPQLRDYEAAGVQRVMLQHLLFRDTDALELIARDVMPALAG